MQMVHSGDEKDHLIYLLSESKINAEKKFQNYKQQQKNSQSLREFEQENREEFEAIM